MKKTNNDDGKRNGVQELWNRYVGKRDVKLRNELVVHYMPLVRMTAARLFQKLPTCVSYDEICSAGYDGLIRAVERYDPAREAKFETFCQQRVSGAVFDWLRTLDMQSRTVREFEKKQRSTSETLSSKLNRKPTDSELAHEMGIGITRYESLSRLSKIGQEVHFSTLEEESNKKNAEEYISDSSASDPSNKINREMFTDFVTRGFNREERLAIVLYYTEGLTMAEIGIVLDLSESRVSQIHKDVLGRIRKKFGHERATI